MGDAVLCGTCVWQGSHQQPAGPRTPSPRAAFAPLPQRSAPGSGTLQRPARRRAPAAPCAGSEPAARAAPHAWRRARPRGPAVPARAGAPAADRWPTPRLDACHLRHRTLAGRNGGIEPPPPPGRGCLLQPVALCGPRVQCGLQPDTLLPGVVALRLQCAAGLVPHRLLSSRQRRWTEGGVGLPKPLTAFLSDGIGDLVQPKCRFLKIPSGAAKLGLNKKKG